MRSKKYYIIIIAVLLVLAACFYLLTVNLQKKEETEASVPAETSAGEESITVAEEEKYFKDKKSLYDYDPLEVTCMYVTVVEGNESTGTNHTFDEVNSFVQKNGVTGVEKILSNAIVKVGDENGPLEGELGYGCTIANATINVRGKSSTLYPQKSYKLKLFDSAGTWRGQSTIALNKHPADPSRLRNQLYYRLMQDIPGLVSLRTSYVHLFICDETASGDGSHAYKDCGLYTQVEQPNSRFLQTHGLTKSGSLYKAFMCEMYRYEDNIKLQTDPDYDQAKFEEILEPKDTTDHTKLIEMLDTVNDYSVPIEDVLDKYFDVDNLIDYLAYNLLTLNADSDAQNYYLYSPSNSEKWYYICWDGDACLQYTESQMMGLHWEQGKYNEGISNYWNVVLFNRMLRNDKYRDMLTERIQKYHDTVITSENVESLVEAYDSVASEYVSREPDKSYLYLGNITREDSLNSIVADVDIAYELYMVSLTKPMPFYIGNAEKTEEGKIKFQWEAAYDFNGEMITYHIDVASDPSFSQDSLLLSEDTLYCETEADMPKQGTYYVRVTAHNISGIQGTAFDVCEVAPDEYVDSTRKFTISENGKIDTYSE